MKTIYSFFLAMAITAIANAQVISIAAARAQAVGNVVTVSGVAINGNEFGTPRYIEDGTAGIALFSTSLASVNRGDIITVTGTLTNFSNLLELSPVSSFTVNSNGNPMPASFVLTPNQFSDTYEGELVQVNNCVFTSGGTFQGSSNYTFTASGFSGIVRINGSNPLVGYPIPTGAVNLTAVLSQYQTNYQMLLRDSNDIVASSAFYITVPPSPTNITQNSLDINYSTNLNGSSLLEYGHTPLLELGYLTGIGGSTTHTVSITGANPSEVFYARGVSVNGTDTALSSTKLYITQSTSSGDIKCYFVRSVNHSVANSPSNYAVQLNNTVADTLAAYIDRAQQTLDIAIYNFDNFNTLPIINAINNAYTRGVQIRIIDDGSNANNAMAQLNAAIPVLPSPTTPVNYYGIMHNKFVVIDASNANADFPIVWTGSTNLTDEQLNTDANNVIIFQDQSLAKVYTMEFEEMWGGSGAQPNLANSKFGPDKSDNTPHYIKVGSNLVQSYFSPSDNVSNEIMNAINTADYEMEFATYVFTRYDIATAIQNRINTASCFAAGVVDDSSNGGGNAFNIMQTVMGSNLELYDHPSLPGILHHKYLIVDQSQSGSDPLVLTGSHNWSTTANTKNDENTVIVHDQNIANQYYQEFVKRFNENGGSLGFTDNTKQQIAYMVYPNPATSEFTVSSKHSDSYRDGDGTEFKVYDVLGNIVFSTPFEKSILKINTVNWKGGVYFFKIISRKSIYNGKVVVE